MQSGPLAEWEKELHQHLESADLILLLISSDFISSDYCYSTEMGRAIERHNQGSAQVIPILLRPIHWDNTPFAKLQVVPTNAIPVTKWSDRDDAFHDITRQVNRVIAEIQTRQALVEEDRHDRIQQKQMAWQSKMATHNPLLAPAFDPTKLVLQYTLNEGVGGRLSKLAIHPDGKTLVCLSDDAIRLRELSSGRELCTFGDDKKNEFICVTISPIGNILASGSRDKTIKLWELPSGRVLHTFTNHKKAIWSLAISPDGNILASGSGDKTIKLWGLPSKHELRTLTGHTEVIYSLAISPNGNILASGSGDGVIRLWELPSGRELRPLIGHTHSIYSLAISPDGNILASGSADYTVKLWELSSGRELRTLTGHTKVIFTVAISPDGNILASSSGDDTVKLWELPFGRELRTINMDQGTDVVFGPDNKTLISRSFRIKDRSPIIQLWKMKTLA